MRLAAAGVASVLLLLAIVVRAVEKPKSPTLFPPPYDRADRKQFAMQYLSAESRSPDGKEADGSFIFYDFDPLAGMDRIFQKAYIPSSSNSFKKLLKWMPIISPGSTSDSGGADAAVARFRVGVDTIQVDRNRSELIIFSTPDSGKLDLSPSDLPSRLPTCFAKLFNPRILAQCKVQPINDTDLGNGDRLRYWCITTPDLPEGFNPGAGVDLTWTNTCLSVRIHCNVTPGFPPDLMKVAMYAPQGTPSLRQARLDETDWPPDAKREIALGFVAKRWLSDISVELKAIARERFSVLDGVGDAMIGQRPVYDDALKTLPMHVSLIFAKQISSIPASSEPFPLEPFNGSSIGKGGILLRIYISEFELPGVHDGNYPLGTRGIKRDLHLIYDLQTNPSDAKLAADIKSIVNKRLAVLEQDLASAK